MANKTLCLDFGNTRLKYAVFEGNMQVAAASLEDGTAASVAKVLDTHQPDKSILSSVIQHDAAIETILDKRTQFHKLSHLTQLPFTTPVGKPETIGADRLALCKMR